MSNDTNQPNQSDVLATEDVLTTEVSDEALEASAAIRSAAYTLGACTGLSVCPA